MSATQGIIGIELLVKTTCQSSNQLSEHVFKWLCGSLGARQAGPSV